MAKTWATKCCPGTYKNNYQLCCGIKDKKLLQKFHIESFRIYAGVQNLFTITKYPLYDPEVSSNVLFDRGVDGFWQAQESPHEATMNSRVYNLGVNLTF